MTKENLKKQVRECVTRILIDWHADSAIDFDDNTILQEEIITDSLDEIDLQLKIENVLGFSMEGNPFGRYYSINDIVEYLWNNYSDKIENL